MPNVIVVKNAEQVAATLHIMGKNGDKYLRESVREGALPLKIAAEGFADEGEYSKGNIAAAIKVRVSVRKGTAKATINPSKKELLAQTGRWYATYVEGGHFTGRRISGRFFGRTAKSEYVASSVLAGRKFVPGTHYMERAFQAAHSEAEQIVERKMIELIQGDFER